jgi:hypothetical protein
VGNFVGFAFGKSEAALKSEAWVELWENQSKQPPKPQANAGASR